MKLLTEKVSKALLRTSKISIKEAASMQSKVIVRFYNPSGVGEWLIVRGEKVDDKWILYGYIRGVTLGDWGFITEDELNNIVMQPFGTKIERDILLEPNVKTVKQILDASF